MALVKWSVVRSIYDHKRYLGGFDKVKNDCANSDGITMNGQLKENLLSKYNRDFLVKINVFLLLNSSLCFIAHCEQTALTPALNINLIKCKKKKMW